MTLADRFRQIGVTREFVRRMAHGPDTLFSPLTPTRKALLCDDPACVLLRAFFCGVAVHGDQLADAFAAEVPWELLIERGAGLFACPYHVRFVRHLLLFSDYVDSRRDAVMGAGETTAVLYEASRPDARLRRVLDLGCGAGTLALLLACDADEVVGTDVNPRAIDIARLNAEINGIANVDFRVGDLYAPVTGEQFDLIVSQPPYYPVEAGSQGQTYLHGGEHGDEIARAVVEGTSRHLRRGGKAFVFASWPAGRERIPLRGMSVQHVYSAAADIPGTLQTLSIIEHSDTKT